MATKSKQSTVPLKTRKLWDEITEPFKRYYKEKRSEKSEVKIESSEQSNS